jgi:hypothetical protein
MCISVRNVGDEVELTIDDVRLYLNEAHRLWRHETFITFASMMTDEVEGRMSRERFERLGRFVHGLLSSLVRAESDGDAR